MSIKAFATSEFEFISGVRASGVTIGTTNGGLIGPYVQEGMMLLGNSRTAPVDWRTNITSGDSHWLSYYCYHDDGTFTNTNHIRIFGPTSELFRMYTNTSEQQQFQYYNGSTWVTLHTRSGMPNVRLRIDVEMTLKASGGRIAIYYDGVLGAELTGNTLFTSSTYPTRLLLSNSDAGTGTANGCSISAMFVADEDSRDIHYWQDPINSNGTNTAWSGDYTAVDEAGANDADFITSDTAGQTETYGFPALDAIFNTGYDVVGVGVSARAKKGASGPANLKLAAYEGTTLGVSADQALDISYAPYFHVFDDNPDTAAPWTVAEVNTAEIGVQSSA